MTHPPILEFVPVKPKSKREEEKDFVGGYLEQAVRGVVYSKVQALYSRADTMSGYELDGYECEDPEELVWSICEYIENNFKWKRRPKLDEFTFRKIRIV